MRTSGGADRAPPRLQPPRSSRALTEGFRRAQADSGGEGAHGPSERPSSVCRPKARNKRTAAAPRPRDSRKVPLAHGASLGTVTRVCAPRAIEGAQASQAPVSPRGHPAYHGTVTSLLGLASIAASFVFPSLWAHSGIGSWGRALDCGRCTDSAPPSSNSRTQPPGGARRLWNRPRCPSSRSPPVNRRCRAR